MRIVILFCVLLMAGNACLAQTTVKKKKAKPAGSAKFMPPRIVANEDVKFTPPKIVANEESDNDLIFSSVEIPAEFPGGQDAWRMFLMKNLNSRSVANQVTMAKDQKSWRQTAMARFIVGINGELTDITIENAVLPAVAAEAKRVLALSPKWLPARQNGRKVKAYHRQPIVFVVEQ